MVLRGGTQHRRAADVDVLDARGEVGAARDRLLEGVEVHDHHVDHLDAVLGRLRHMRFVIALGEQAAVHERMKRLHAAVHHLGELGHIVDRRDGNARLGDDLGRAAGRDDLRAELLGKRPGELDDAGFVGNRYEHALHFRIAHDDTFPLDG